jgi:DNA-binding transcriptional MerR regulator
MNGSSNNESTYRIGAVSRLTDIPPDTLRVWERRYTVVEPQRTDGGSRLYSDHDVARLALIKRLVDAGHSIGTVANLDLERLKERILAAQGAKAGKTTSAKGPVTVAIIGATLSVRLRPELKAVDGDAMSVAGAFTGLDEFERIAGSTAVDVLVVELTTLNEEPIAKVRRTQRLCGARRLVIVYGFARKLQLAQLADQRVTTLRFPVRWEELYQACCASSPPVSQVAEMSELERALGASIPARLFDDAQLASASGASTTIKCECPHHVAELIIALSRFEQYSSECENRGRDDAALHAYLHVMTARARQMLEEALIKIIEVEDISLDEPAVN